MSLRDKSNFGATVGAELYRNGKLVIDKPPKKDETKVLLSRQGSGFVMAELKPKRKGDEK